MRRISKGSAQRAAAIAAAFATAALAAPGSAFAVVAPDERDAAPALDVRAGERASVPAATRDARRSLAQRLGTAGVVASEPVSGGVRSIGRSDGFLTAAGSADAAAVALGYVRDRGAVFGLDADDLAALRLARRYVSDDGVTHLTWIQTSDDIDAYDSVLNANVDADGRLVNIGGDVVADLELPSADPTVTASQALATARHGLGSTPGLPAAQTQPDPARRTTFANGDSAQLVAFAAPSGDRLAWRLTVAGATPYYYDTVVDARSGELLARASLTDFAAAQVYRFHPSAPSGGVAATVDLAGSGGLWLNDTAGNTRLQGRNAHAYADVNGNNAADAGEEIAATGGDWSFPLRLVTPAGVQFCSPFGPTCTWDGVNAGSESTNRAQTTTQLFYFVNAYHDWLAQPAIGFTDRSGNFEDGDRVLAESDDNSTSASPSFNNANMSTLPDGSSPRMQMFLFKTSGGTVWPAVNSGDDASVVYHEYTHGLSNRLVGGGTGTQLRQKQPRAMGEGWSDFYALDNLAENGLVADTAADGEIAVGAYVTANTTTGIRREALDCPVGSGVPSCVGTASSGRGGFTYADLGRVGAFSSGLGRFEEHDDGEIWAQTLWDLRRAVGAATARRLVTNAMRLTVTPNPSFLDERDAILQADLVAGAPNRAAIWQVFAVRGMGYGARTTSANATRGVASVATPALTAVDGVALDDNAPLGDGDETAEPGEAVRLSVALDNPAAVALTNVRATLTPTTPGVFAGVDSAAVGTIAAGDSATAPFVVTLPAALQCGTQAAFRLDVSSDQGAISLPLTQSLGAGRATVTAADVPRAIPDNAGGSGTVSTLTVPTGGRIDQLRVSLTIAHTWVGDVRAQLTGPSGTAVELVERPGTGILSQRNGLAVLLDDGATNSIQLIPDTEGPAVTGFWRPDEPLAAFAGQDRAGVWTLRVTDAVGGDVGTLNGWSIETDQPTCSAGAPLPTVATGAASAIGDSGATLAAAVDPAGTATELAFEYGTSTAYGARTAAVAAAGAGSVAAAGLAPGTTYHYRALALRGGAPVARGEDRTFTTTATPVTPPPGGGATAPGVVGPQLVRPPPIPRPTIAFKTRSARLGRGNRFTVTFTVRPATAGSLAFAFPKVRRTPALTIGTARFRAGAGRVTVTVSGRALRRLRQLRSARVAATFRLAGGTRVTSTFRLTLAGRRARRARR